MNGDYPTKEELKKIKEWNIKDPFGLIEFLEKMWHWDDYIKVKGKRVKYVELHTGGWSGNEDIIGVLLDTMFWVLYWERAVRGGHYYFKVYKLK